MLLPPLVAPSVAGVLWMYPSMLRWTFGVLFVGVAFCLPILSLLYFFVLLRLVSEFAIVGLFVGVDGAGDCQNYSTVGWFDGKGVPFRCC